MFAGLVTGQILAVVLVVVGLVACFFGYRLFQLLIGFIGFLFGSVAAGALYSLVSGEPGAGPIVASLVGGIAGAVLFFLVYPVAVFFLGAGLGLVLAGPVRSLVSFDPQWVLWAAGIAGGILALVLQRFVIMAATAFLGAWIALQSGFFLAGLPSVLWSPEFSRLAIPAAIDLRHLLGWVLLGAAGLAVQATGKTRAKSSRESKAEKTPG